jgi:hypothetical protein
MRDFFFRRIPDYTRILIVESGSRYLLDNLLPEWNKVYGAQLEVDLVTCFGGEPAGFRPNGRVYRVWEYPDAASRQRLVNELKANRYLIVGIVCSGEPIMTKWKWWLAWKLPAKLFLLNENGDYFWFDYSNWKTMLHFLAFRAGLTGPDAVTTISQLLLFPFTLLYLLCYAAVVHVRRKARKA